MGRLKGEKGGWSNFRSSNRKSFDLQGTKIHTGYQNPVFVVWKFTWCVHSWHFSIEVHLFFSSLVYTDMCMCYNIIPVASFTSHLPSSLNYSANLQGSDLVRYCTCLVRVGFYCFVILVMNLTDCQGASIYFAISL